MAISIRPLLETDVEAAETVVRLAFGTFFGLPDPLTFGGGSRRTAFRVRGWPDGALLAEKDGEMVGTAISVRWGSLGVFGPLAVHPTHWRGGVARALLDATMPIYDRWGCRAAVLFTFPSSLTHVGLYQSYGFWPRSLTAIMSRGVGDPSMTTAETVSEWQSFTALDRGARADAIAQCARLSDSLFPGLDLGEEIALLVAHPTSDVVALTEGSRVTGFALCHCGADCEADAGMAYVKFAAVERGPQAPRRFQRLLAACNDFAQRSGASRLSAGVNLGCMDAYRLMLNEGFRTVLQGIAMHRPWIEIYDRPDIFALEDWR